jgi:quinol monooxygenase YgiN
MYGTVAKLHIKPGSEAELMKVGEEIERRDVPGFINTYIYRLDNEPDTLMMAVIFQDKKTYFANANSPQQNEQFQKMMQYMTAEPEWHDGEIIYQSR